MEKQPRAGGGRAALMASLFAVYLLLLVWLVLWRFEVPWTGGGALRQVKLVPFLPTGDADANTAREVVANAAFFVPFGIYLALFAPAWRWWQGVAVAAGASVALEVAQYVLAVGSSDVTDLIANAAGALAGIGVIALVRRRLGMRAEVVMARVCLIATVLAVLATVLLVVSGLRYAPPQDGAPAPAQSAAAERTIVDGRRLMHVEAVTWRAWRAASLVVPTGEVSHCAIDGGGFVPEGAASSPTRTRGLAVTPPVPRRSGNV
ncbi:VanZ family protein [Occultella kanbiaonis]|uniref:VanZ family protein n=1 Tax=Occultella kanbiaonis TaxID=2675754 RepID=UPI001A998198|nr:VanZ family protein [Occultella kanbiaonis]